MDIVDSGLLLLIIKFINNIQYFGTILELFLFELKHLVYSYVIESDIGLHCKDLELLLLDLRFGLVTTRTILLIQFSGYLNCISLYNSAT